MIVATAGNDVYALGESTGQPVWHAHIGSPVPSRDLSCGDISPSVGIISTPVIDAQTGTLDVVADVWDGSNASHVLVALDAMTGAERAREAIDPSGSTPTDQLQRTGLALSGGRVLIGFGGNDGDCGSYWGWLVSAPETAMGATAVWKAPTTKGGAIWAGGGAPAIDAAGAAYIATGNAASTSNQNYDHGNTLEKFNSQAGELDSFAPSSWASDSANDADLGSVAPQLLPGNLAYQGGKNGNGYLVSTTHLGGIGGQLYQAPVCDSYGADAYQNGTIYVSCTSGVRALSLDTSKPSFALSWRGPSDANGPPIVAGGLVWVAATGNDKLYGLDPRTGSVVVNQPTPAMENFVTPAASDGKLFLATGGTVSAYTIAAALPQATPPSTPAAATPTPPASPAPGRCASRLELAVHHPHRARIKRVAVYLGNKRIYTRRGHRLTRISVAPPVDQTSFTLRIVERTHSGRRLHFRVVYRNCKREPRGK